MKLADAIDLKSQFLQEYIRDYGAKDYRRVTTTAIAESMVTGGPSDRLAIGVSVEREKGKEGAQLELRVQRRDGPAYREAMKIIEKTGKRARLWILPRIEFPSFASLMESIQADNMVYPSPKDPLRIGHPIRSQKAGLGTIGGFVTTPDGLALLSSSHVIAAGDKPKVGDSIYRPTGARHLSGRLEVANLYDWNVLDAASGNYFDAAIAELVSDLDHEANMVPARPDVPQRLHGRKLVAMPAARLEEITAQFRDGHELLGASVAKIGAASGFSEGHISAGLVDGITAYAPKLGNVVYMNVFEITPSDATSFSQPGDSGSCVFTSEGTVIGLHFASSDAFDQDGRNLGFRVSYACSVQAVLEHFRNHNWM